MRLVIVFLTLLTGLAFGQEPVCNGDVTVVRVSTTKPGGTMKNFLAAIDAQKNWYRANGVKENEIFAARIISGSRSAGDLKISETEVMSYHVRPPSMNRIPNRGDDAWKAFVKLFQENSEIKSEHMTCTPKQGSR